MPKGSIALGLYRKFGILASTAATDEAWTLGVDLFPDVGKQIGGVLHLIEEYHGRYNSRKSRESSVAAARMSGISRDT